MSNYEKWFNALQKLIEKRREMLKALLELLALVAQRLELTKGILALLEEILEEIQKRLDDDEGFGLASPA